MSQAEPFFAAPRAEIKNSLFEINRREVYPGACTSSRSGIHLGSTWKDNNRRPYFSARLNTTPSNRSSGFTATAAATVGARSTVLTNSGYRPALNAGP